MSQTIRITEQDLRAAMRDQRYWRPGHPERVGFGRWVSDGWQALYPRDGGPRSAVWVRAYVRDGKPVAAHWRSAAARGGGSALSDETPDDPALIQANWLTQLGRRLSRAPDRGGSGAARTGPLARARRVDGAGNDNVQSLRNDSGSVWDRRVSGGSDQWNRSGGEAQRALDVQRLRPQGEPQIYPDGRTVYRLQDGRNAVLRPSTSPGSDGVATLEIQEPFRNRMVSTDKFRYPAGR